MLGRGYEKGCGVWGMGRDMEWRVWIGLWGGECG